MTKKSKFGKLLLLLALLPRNPTEVYDRLTAILETRWEKMRAKPPHHGSMPLREALEQYGTTVKNTIAPILEEKPLKDIEAEVLGNIQAVEAKGPFLISHNADISLARFCYVMVRTRMPDVVIETGVAYGLTSAFILQALTANGKGELWSVDLPPLAYDPDSYVGVLIPTRLRGPWHLCRGSAVRCLPDLLKSVRNVDLFIHDSLHTYRNITKEFELVWPFIRPGGILMADDIEGNRAFVDFVMKVNPSLYGVIREEKKESLFGFLVKNGAN